MFITKKRHNEILDYMERLWTRERLSYDNTMCNIMLKVNHHLLSEHVHNLNTEILRLHQEKNRLLVIIKELKNS